MPNIFKNPATAAITGGVALPFGMDWLQHEDVKVPVVDSVLDMTQGKFDKFRTGNFLLNGMIGAASGGLMAKPKTLVQGASLAALAPAKDLLLNMQGTPEKVNKVLDEMPEATRALKDAGSRSNILMGILGAGALGLGGAALWKYMKKRDDIPGENGTIQYIMKGKEGDPETDALVTVPINNPAVSPSVAEDMNISVRRGLGKAVKWNSRRRDPNTGRLIPYAVWNNLYGHKDEAEPAKAPNSAYDAKSGDNDPNGMNKDAAKKKDKNGKKGRRTAGTISGASLGALRGLLGGTGLVPGALGGAAAGMEADTYRNLNASLKEGDRKNGGMIAGGVLGGLGGGALGALAAPENKAVGIPLGVLLGALAGGKTGMNIDSYRASDAVADKISKKRKGKEHSNRFGGVLAGALAGAGLGGLAGSLKRDEAGNTGLGLGAGTGIGAGLGAISGGLLGSKVDEYRNLTDADEMLGNGRDHKAPLIGAGAGGLLGAILGGVGGGPGGAVGGALAGAGSGALFGTGVGSYLKSNDIVDKEEEPEKNAAAEGFNAMAYNSGSGTVEGVLKAVNRFTRPVGTERKDDHSYTEGSHNTHSAGLGLNDAGGNAGINKAASQAVDPGDMRGRFIDMVGNTLSNAAGSVYGAVSDAADWVGGKAKNVANTISDWNNATMAGKTIGRYRDDRYKTQRAAIRNAANNAELQFRRNQSVPLTNKQRRIIRVNNELEERDRLYRVGREAGTLKPYNVYNHDDVMKELDRRYNAEMGRGPIDMANTRAELEDTQFSKKSSREFAEGAGTVSSGLLGGALGGAGGAAVASGMGYDPKVGGAAGALLGALVPNLTGYLTGKVAGPRPAGDLELHDGHSDLAEYVVPGYASYQYARRTETEDAAAKAKEDTMKSYLATGAMPGGQDGIPSNLDSDEEEDYGNFKSAAAQDAVAGQQPNGNLAAMSKRQQAFDDAYNRAVQGGYKGTAQEWSNDPMNEIASYNPDNKNYGMTYGEVANFYGRNGGVDPSKTGRNVSAPQAPGAAQPAAAQPQEAAAPQSAGPAPAAGSGEAVVADQMAVPDRSTVRTIPGAPSPIVDTAVADQGMVSQSAGNARARTEGARRVGGYGVDDMSAEQKARYEALKNPFYRHSDGTDYSLAGKREAWLRDYDRETENLIKSYKLGDDSTVPTLTKNLSNMEDEIRGKKPAYSSISNAIAGADPKGYDPHSDKVNAVMRHVNLARRMNRGRLVGGSDSGAYGGSYIDPKTYNYIKEQLGDDLEKWRPEAHALSGGLLGMFDADIRPGTHHARNLWMNNANMNINDLKRYIAQSQQ